ncbi:fused response regulator/phosphatase [Paenibacillus sp. UMB4589-SE434]|uniref:fused response regulator/phosphatase n=1 Tax=Paenibacillus sp. UMB4589-SE434 TaxID=3046314 RepID=UPI00254E4FA7|nr:fused response regulator/phosphatase [Paenibacillus sp. UMB4589-SE434]MDK8183191.1 fused response regulator/phosphatase [Paenibacillus sp. UMB4589-SE434]
MNVLVVDDNPTNVMLIREILRKADYTGITTVSSAREMYEVLGLKKSGISTDTLKEPDIDLILLDMMMPEIDGLEACRHVQTFPLLRDIPIIMVTAIGDSNTLAEALDAGAVDYVTKPINRIELLARIRLALRLKKEKDWHKERDRHIREELRLAASVQASVLTEPYSDEQIEIQAIYRPSEELAGDLYAWFPLGNGKYGVLILDMMGHGVSSALLCMFIASALRNTVMSEETPDGVLRSLNSKFHYLHMSDSLTMYYLTAIYAIVDTKQHLIQYANAGHPPGIVVMSDGAVVHLESTGHPVGMFPELEVESKMIMCTNEYRMALYTDGLVEAAGDELDDAIEHLTELMKQEDSIDADAWSALFGNPCAREDDKCMVWVSVRSMEGETA